MNRVSAAIQGVVTGVGGAVRTVAAGSSMLFNRARGWFYLFARTRFDYRSEVGDPLQNSAVAASIGWIARNFPEAPVRIRRLDATDSDTFYPPASTGPGAMLRLLERPNPWYSGVLQWIATLVDYCQGNAYWLKVRHESGRVVQLWWTPARYIEPRWPEDDPTVFISHYEYAVNGVSYRIHPADVVHFRNGLDPVNPRKGLSPLGSLLREIFTDNEAAQFTATLLRNLGVPGVVLAPANTVTNPGNVDVQQTKEQWKSTFSGDNRGEPAVFRMPTNVQVLSFNPQQMELRALRRIPEERITAVLGVPAGVAGLGAGLDRNTFTNYGEANRAAYTQGVIPLQRLIAAELEVQLLDDFADLDREALDVDFNYAVASAMQEAADAVWRRTESAATKGLLTRKRFLEINGQPTSDADDIYVIPNNYIFERAGGHQPPSSRLTGFSPMEPHAAAENGHSAEPIGVTA